MKNRIDLIGRIGGDPELINLEGGNKLCKFSMATSETYKNSQGEKVKDTQWHSIVVFGKRAEVINQYVSKGDLLSLEGTMKYRKWENKDGVKMTSAEIHVTNFCFLEKKGSSSEQSVSAPAAEDDSELPF